MQSMEQETSNAQTVADGANDLRVLFPATPGYLTVCRLNASAIGADAGLDTDGLDDLRLAITEAAAFLLSDDACGGEVELRLAHDEKLLFITGTRTGVDLPPRSLDDLSQAILGATVDRFVVNEVPGTERGITVVKSVSPSS